MRIQRVIWIALHAAFLVTACARTPDTETTGRTAGPPAPTEAEVRAANDSAGAVGTLFPVDEGASDASFAAFRGDLKATIERQDTAALLAVVDPHIRVSFGDDNGIGAFRRAWLGPDAHGDVWQELGDLLALGGVFRSESLFVAPYTFAVFPEDLDGFEHVVVTGTDVPLRAAPLDDAAVVATVSHAIFRLHRNQTLARGLDGWTAVERGAAEPAFVESRAVRSPLDYRAFFTRSGGAWRMSLLVAGD